MRGANQNKLMCVLLLHTVLSTHVHAYTYTARQSPTGVKCVSLARILAFCSHPESWGTACHRRLAAWDVLISREMS